MALVHQTVHGKVNDAPSPNGSEHVTFVGVGTQEQSRFALVGEQRLNLPTFRRRTR